MSATITSDQFRVMIVDDSAVIRGLLTRALEADPAITVVASVSNGQNALNTLDRHDVEIVVLDIEMPVMDGMTALPLLLKAKPGIQVLMASTLTRKNAEISLRAMAMGAADYVSKPTATSEIHSADSFKRELVEKVKALAVAGRGARRGALRPGPASPRVAPGGPHSAATHTGREKEIVLRLAPRQVPDLIAIGSSTGGPQALLKLLAGLGSEVGQPILITQHMPATFTALLAGHIGKTAGRPCAEGVDGETIRPGHIYLAPGGYHMVVKRTGTRDVIRLNQDKPENFCRPAVDPMLFSLAPLYGSRMMVVILTGMGCDGQKGAEAVVKAGGSVIAQDEASSVVWGMPGAVATSGLCSAVLPLGEIAPYIRKLVVRSAA